MNGSGEMTDRAAKFTRLPIMFLRKSPSFFSSCWRMPGASEFSAVVESISALTSCCRRSQPCVKRSCSAARSAGASAAASAALGDDCSESAALRMRCSATFWPCSYFWSPKTLGGRKRFGGTASARRKKTLASAAAPAPAPAPPAAALALALAAPSSAASPHARPPAAGAAAPAPAPASAPSAPAQP